MIRFLTSVRENQIFALQLAIATALLLLIIKGNWSGDFWEHAAIVHAFSLSNDPIHPLLALDVDHPFFSPYLLFLGWGVRYSGLSVLTVMSIAGFFNLIFLLHYLSKFLKTVLKSDKTVLFALLFIFFIWAMPWQYSGFLSINGLFYILPYPSTFAMGLIFYLMYKYHSARWGNIKSYLLTSILLFLIITTHPLSGIISCIGLFSIGIYHFGIKPDLRWLIFFLAVLSSFVLVFMWPYYPFEELLLGAGDVFHPSNEVMYDRPLIRSSPAILGLPVMAWYFKREKDNSLILFFGLLLTIYIFGFISEKWAYGRVVSFMAIICHIYLAKAVAEILKIENSYFKKIKKIIPLSIYFASLGSAAIFLASKYIPLNEWQIAANKYDEITPQLYEEDIILAEEKTAWAIPSFGGKIVACDHVQAFVPDYEERHINVDRFFSKKMIDNDQRTTIVNKYHVNKVLLKEDDLVSASLKNWLANNTKQIFKGDGFVLYTIVQEKVNE